MRIDRNTPTIIIVTQPVCIRHLEVLVNYINYIVHKYYIVIFKNYVSIPLLIFVLILAQYFQTRKNVEIHEEIKLLSVIHIYLPGTIAICSSETLFRKRDFKHSTKILDVTLYTTLHKLISLKSVILLRCSLKRIYVVLVNQRDT